MLQEKSFPVQNTVYWFLYSFIHNFEITMHKLPFSSPCTSPSSTQYSVPLLYLTLKHSVVQSQYSCSWKLINVSLNMSFVRHAFSLLHWWCILCFISQHCHLLRLSSISVRGMQYECGVLVAQYKQYKMKSSKKN